MITTGGEGKVPPRKRIRGKIGDPSSAPELKTHNLLRNDDDPNDTFYSGTMIYGVWTNTAEGLWYPTAGHWPTVGTGAHQRIGKKIRVKLLRLKGYVAYSPYLITQVRYRIVMYRTRRAGTYSHSDWLVPMYSEFGDLNVPNNMNGWQNYCVRDYYCSFFDREYLKQHDIKRRVLFRGIIQPQPDIGNYKMQLAAWAGMFAYGDNASVVNSLTTGKECGTIVLAGQSGSGGYFNTSSLDTAVQNIQLNTSTSLQNIPMVFNEPAKTFSGEFQKHYVSGQGEDYDAVTPVNQRGFFPIDLTVHMNDNVDCEQYDYVFVVESDWCCGQNERGVFAHTKAKTNFNFFFIPQIYYTDD